MRPLRIAAWLARQGYFIAAWALWECYSRSLCQTLDEKVDPAGGKSTVHWVKHSLAANGICFPDYGWFESANAFGTS